MDKSIAVIGAGGSADKFFDLYKLEDFDVFTSSGSGNYLERKIKPISSFDPSNYLKVYILVYEYKIFLRYFMLPNTSYEVFWFDSIRSKLLPLLDENASSLADYSNWGGKQALTVIYDLRTEPVTFDFVVFLADSDMERRKQKKDYINLIIAPGDFDGVNKNWQVEENDEKSYRLYNLIYPAIQLLECKVFIYHSSTRKEANRLWDSLPNSFPEKHDFLNPIQRHRYNIIFERINRNEDHWVFNRSLDIYKRQVDSWILANAIKKSRLISITLRETFRAISRNSLLEEWFKFADYLNSRGYDVVFVRDSSKCFEPLRYSGRHWVFDAPSINLMLRKEFSRACQFCFGVNNGPNVLLYFDPEIRYYTYHLCDEDYVECSAVELTNYGFSENSAPQAKPWQRICWKKEKLERLIDGLSYLEKVCNE